MAPKINCWQFKKCGREPGGTHETLLGTCSAAAAKKANGIHNGINGGRACWVVAGTLCGGKIQGSFAEKIGGCDECDFYKMVQRQEPVFKDRIDILHQLGYKIK
ncbi:MAG: hypothetical protein P8X96_21415 [Desulfobacteraceae bacterium]